MLGARLLELQLQILDRAAQIVAALGRGLGVGRIGEMLGVADAGPCLFGSDLAIELARIPRELADHQLDAGKVAALLLDCEAFETDNGSSRFHRRATPEHMKARRPRRTELARDKATLPRRGCCFVTRLGCCILTFPACPAMRPAKLGSKRVTAASAQNQFL